MFNIFKKKKKEMTDQEIKLFISKQNWIDGRTRNLEIIREFSNKEDLAEYTATLESVYQKSQDERVELIQTLLEDLQDINEELEAFVETTTRQQMHREVIIGKIESSVANRILSKARANLLDKYSNLLK